MQNTITFRGLSENVILAVVLIVTLVAVAASAADLYVRGASTTSLSMTLAEQDKYAALKDRQFEQKDVIHLAHPTEKYFELKDGQVWQLFELKDGQVWLLEAVPSSNAPAKVRPQSYAELKDQQIEQKDAAQFSVTAPAISSPYAGMTADELRRERFALWFSNSTGSGCNAVPQNPHEPAYC